MKICVAQTKPVKGNVQANIKAHQKLIALAVRHGANLIVFPELSITGYEPELAAALATGKEDSRFDDFQILSDTNRLVIGLGMPLKVVNGTCISMLIFQPHQARQLYTKKHLHADELPFFLSGEHPVLLHFEQTRVALAICYELSVPEHSAAAYGNAASVYIASVAKSATGAEQAGKTLASIARQYGMTVLMTNCIGYCDNFYAGGKTAVWNDQGDLLAQLDNSSEGILVMDTATQQVIEEII